MSRIRPNTPVAQFIGYVAEMSIGDMDDALETYLTIYAEDFEGIGDPGELVTHIRAARLTTEDIMDILQEHESFLTSVAEEINDALARNLMASAYGKQMESKKTSKGKQIQEEISYEEAADYRRRNWARKRVRKPGSWETARAGAESRRWMINNTKWDLEALADIIEAGDVADLTETGEGPMDDIFPVDPDSSDEYIVKTQEGWFYVDTQGAPYARYTIYIPDEVADELDLEWVVDMGPVDMREYG